MKLSTSSRRRWEVGCWTIKYKIIRMVFSDVIKYIFPRTKIGLPIYGIELYSYTMSAIKTGCILMYYWLYLAGRAVVLQLFSITYNQYNVLVFELFLSFFVLHCESTHAGDLSVNVCTVATSSQMFCSNICILSMSLCSTTLNLCTSPASITCVEWSRAGFWWPWIYPSSGGHHIRRAEPASTRRAEPRRPGPGSSHLRHHRPWPGGRRRQGHCGANRPVFGPARERRLRRAAQWSDGTVQWRERAAPHSGLRCSVARQNSRRRAAQWLSVTSGLCRLAMFCRGRLVHKLPVDIIVCQSPTEGIQTGPWQHFLIDFSAVSGRSARCRRPLSTGSLARARRRPTTRGGGPDGRCCVPTGGQTGSPARPTTATIWRSRGRWRFWNAMHRDTTVAPVGADRRNVLYLCLLSAHIRVKWLYFQHRWCSRASVVSKVFEGWDSRDYLSVAVLPAPVAVGSVSALCWYDENVRRVCPVRCCCMCNAAVVTGVWRIL